MCNLSQWMLILMVLRAQGHPWLNQNRTLRYIISLQREENGRARENTASSMRVCGCTSSMLCQEPVCVGGCRPCLAASVTTERWHRGLEVAMVS